MSRKLVVAHLPEFAGMRICDTYLGDTRITARQTDRAARWGRFPPSKICECGSPFPLVDNEARFIVRAAKELITALCLLSQ